MTVTLPVQCEPEMDISCVYMQPDLFADAGMGVRRTSSAPGVLTTCPYWEYNLSLPTISKDRRSKINNEKKDIEDTRKKVDDNMKDTMFTRSKSASSTCERDYFLDENISKSLCSSESHRGESLPANKSFISHVNNNEITVNNIHGGMNCESHSPSNRPDSLEMVTWNLASPNNNPFEFWVTLQEENGEYVRLMHGVEQFINDPGSRDTSVGSIFTPSMFADLVQEMSMQGIQGLDDIERVFKSEYQHRKIVDEFLKDKMIGSKRLVSMPDRITNAVPTSSGFTLTRPSAISSFQGDMETVADWWPLWKNYMFHLEVELKETKKGKAAKVKSISSLLEPISRSKYPDLTEEEAAMSVPLQLLALAIFDAILVHILHAVGASAWQGVKQALFAALYKNRAASCVSILRQSYASSDLLFLQEASASFVDMVKESLDGFILIEPPNLDRVRNQNSLILASRSRFLPESAVDVTNEVVEGMSNKSMVAPGDLIAATITARDGSRYLLASFHSDSCGLATTPVLSAVHAAARMHYPEHILVLGLDANTYSERPDPAAPAPVVAAADDFNSNCNSRGYSHGGALAPTSSAPVGGAGGCAGVGMLMRSRSLQVGCELRRTTSSVPVNSTTSFSCVLSQMGMESCWGEEGHVTAWTTCIARTFLQPQLHKAVSLSDALSARHCHLKDWVVFYGDQLSASSTRLDNTGHRNFAQRVFPAQSFPSDHAIVIVTLRPAEPAPPPPRRDRPLWQ